MYTYKGDNMNIGFLHPGNMGITLAISAQNSGHTACWVSEGRGEETRSRAQKYGLEEKKTLEELCSSCSILISVCPPHAAADVAASVARLGYTGIYADVNAVSPKRTETIRNIVEGGGAQYVDGGIIGLPAWKPGTTWLLLSGPAAEEVASCFSGGPIETELLGDEIGRASALKMCFAANTKGAIALQCAVAAAAEKLGVRDHLELHWQRFFGEERAAKMLEGIQKVTSKAWRFSAEMDEISDTLESAGIPGGFHKASKNIYDRLAGFKDAPELPSVQEVVERINQE